MALIMEIIDRIPLSVGLNDLPARWQEGHWRARLAFLDDFIAGAQSLIAPRAVYEVFSTEACGEGTIEVGGVAFRSPVLRSLLERVQEAFPYIITIGSGLENAAAVQGDLLRQYVLEEIANVAIEKAVAWLAAHLEERHALGPLSNISPGSLEDWPITEQGKLFSLFGDTEGLVGVRLTENQLMIPRKSVSGILFPSKEGFVACQICRRERCPGRKAPYAVRS